jgi:hypothetical protein
LNRYLTCTLAPYLKTVMSIWFLSTASVVHLYACGS